MNDESASERPDEPPQIPPDLPISVHRIQSIKHLSASEIDQLPIGVVKLDHDGVVLAYNEAESRLAGLRSEDVIGRNFFTEIAPCTNVQEFAGRFRRGLQREKMFEAFPYVFTFPKRETHVVVTLYYEKPNPHAWIFVELSG